MSDKRSEAQQNRRARERAESSAATQAARVAEVAAARAPDGPMEFQPDPNAAADAFSRNRDDAPPREVQRGNPARTMAYDQIMSERKERAENTVHEAPRDEPAVSTEKPARQPEPQSQQVEAPQATEAPATTVAQVAEPETVEVKIDGQVSKVPKAEVEDYGGVKAYQIIKAQEKRLAEANRYANDLGTMFRQLQQAMQKPAQPQPKPEEIVRDAITKIQFGAPEEAQAAFAQAIQALVPRQPDSQAVAMQAYLLTQVTDAENRFIEANKDLVDNQMIRQIVVNEKNRRLAEYQRQKRLPENWNAFYNSIATDVRAALGRPPIATAHVPQQPASQSTNGLAEKEARKASIVALPTAATRAAAPEAEKPLTRDDILAKARKARGQPV